MRRPRFARPGELVERYLNADETVIFDEAPDLRSWLWTQWLEVLVAVAVVVIMAVSRDAMVVALGFVMELSLLGVVGWRYLAHLYTRYVLTDHRVLRVCGVLRREYEWISWKKVTDVSVHRTVTDRWLNTATIRIQSANEASGFKEMADVPNPEGFCEAIVELVNAANGPIVVRTRANR